MKLEEINSLIDKQRKHFLTGKTIPVKSRIEKLNRLRNIILKYETEIEAAIKKDLGKGAVESYMCEVGLSLDELRFMVNHVKKFAREKRVKTPMAHYVSRSYKKPSPRGVVLIMSPWNYPFLLTMDPLIDAIAAGNTVIVKPSAYSPYTTEIMAKIIEECFSEEDVAVVRGGRAENEALLSAHFDYIFFTGSKTVGKKVMESAAKYLTPVTLELGGKSPCIVDKDANIKLAARRIVFGKYLNCGQTCVAPDYIFCHKDIRDKFVEEVKKQIEIQFGQTPLDNDDYGKIINQKHFERVSGLINQDKVVCGGKVSESSLKIEPTVMIDITTDDAVMQEEIFGPLMPIMTFEKMEEVIDYVNSNDHPLAFYIFTSSNKNAKNVIERCGFGGGCINDTIIHLATPQMGFGGFGESGMGSYHGKVGFDTFSHTKSIVDKKTFLDLPMRYQPYTKLNEKLIRFFVK